MKRAPDESVLNFFSQNWILSFDTRTDLDRHRYSDVDAGTCQLELGNATSARAFIERVTLLEGFKAVS